MSHSYESSNGTKFAFNSDFSGNISIFRPDGEAFEVDGDDIIELVLERHFKAELISIIGDINIAGALYYLKEVARLGKRPPKTPA